MAEGGERERGSGMQWGATGWIRAAPAVTEPLCIGCTLFS